MNEEVNDDFETTEEEKKDEKSGKEEKKEIDKNLYKQYNNETSSLLKHINSFLKG